MRIGIIAGEASGDILGEGLIRSLRTLIPSARFEGVAGPRMRAAGCEALYPQERLAVMGFVEVLGRFRELLDMRRRLLRHFIQSPPDIVVGVDAPDFNLRLEQGLRQAGIPTVHYVSPSVWAWRRYRLRRIARAVDCVLTLFPFEERFYVEHGIPVRFVGHPLADEIPLEPDRAAARQALGLPAEGPVVALLPGSRSSELRYLAEPFVATARWLHQRRPDIHFVAPFAGEETRAQFEAALGGDTELPITLVNGRSREAMTAADAVLLASGTATLEAMLLKRPMVVSYRMSAVSYQIYKHLVKVPHVALPNLLAEESLVPELLQEAATPERLGPAVLEWLENPERVSHLTASFSRIHETLRQDASRRAAEAVLATLERTRE